MRRFFSFRSSSSNAGDSSKPPSAAVTEACGENPGPSSTGDSSKGRYGSSWTSCPKQSSTTDPHLRRSRSLSSSSLHRGMGEGYLDHDCVSTSSTCCEASQHSTKSRIRHSHSQFSSAGTSDRNNALDLYIDKEHQERKLNSRQNYCTLSGSENVEKKGITTNSGRPPRAFSTAANSPAPTEDNKASQSFRGVRDIHKFINVQEQEAGDLVSSQEFNNRRSRRPLSLSRTRVVTKSLDYDSEATNWTEEIYGVSSGYWSGGNCVNHTQENIDCSSMFDTMTSRKQSPPGPIFMSGGLQTLKLHDEKEGEDLLLDLKEAEERVRLLSLVDNHEKLRNSSLSVPRLLQVIKKIDEDRRNLAVELLTQIQYRVAEKARINNTWKLENVELSSAVIRLENEKNEMQKIMEKELDRRSSDWQENLQKFQSEEQRLKEQVRELAESNVLLQKETSLARTAEAQLRERITELEMELSTLTSNLEEVERENQSSDLVRATFAKKEMEFKELEEVSVRLHRICNEQDKTIVGLRKQLNGVNEKEFVEKGSSRWTMEHFRLTGVEQSLRKELQSCRHELKSLKHENISLLERLRSTTSDGPGISLFRLDQELSSRVTFLLNSGLLLLAEHSNLCAKLLDHIETKHTGTRNDASSQFNDNGISEFVWQFQNLKGKMELMKKSLNSTVEIMAEKTHLCMFEHRLSVSNVEPSKNHETKTEDDLEYELKMETLVARLLRENLCFKEVELEKAHEEISKLVRGHEVLQSEVVSLQDKLASMMQGAKEIELQIQMKDENIKQLRQESEDLMKELAVGMNTLTKVTKERDHLWEELKRSKESCMLVIYERDSFKRKVESLDEDILVKEGQIAILKDSLKRNTFDAVGRCEFTPL